ncbi:MAG: lectin [Ectothiorhodospiraceae bacterium]|nr:lectin [Ectothiorhodospiraceae bacterium]
MRSTKCPPRRLALIAALAVAAGMTTVTHAQQAEMTFFVTSAGPGNGADLGGLEGADAHCAKLATAAGSAQTAWRAYLSTSPKIDRSGDRPRVIPGVSARDRIGNGPWHNAKGALIARDLDDLHSAGNKVDKANALDESGKPVNGRGDKPNRHDILTGSDPSGLYSTAGGDTTCGDWTNSGEGSAIVGHHDRAGLSNDWHMLSWNSSHATVGCSQDALKRTGGDGLFYCFVAK